MIFALTRRQATLQPLNKLLLMSPTKWYCSCTQDIPAQFRTNSTKPTGVNAVADDIRIWSEAVQVLALTVAMRKESSWTKISSNSDWKKCHYLYIGYLLTRAGSIYRYVPVYACQAIFNTQFWRHAKIKLGLKFAL